MDKTFLVLANNELEVLMRVVGLLRRKGYDLKNISMGLTETPTIAYLAITLLGENSSITKLLNHIGKMTDVYWVEEIEALDVLGDFSRNAKLKANELQAV